MEMIKELKEMIKNEEVRSEIYKYLQTIQDLKTRGGQTELHKTCYSIAEEFIRVNGLDNNCVSYIIGTVKEENSYYIIDVSIRETENEWKYIDIAIDSKTMLITTVFGMDEYILY
jgi:hypothetical protein